MALFKKSGDDLNSYDSSCREDINAPQTISWKSTRWLLSYFGLDQRGDQLLE